MQLLPLFTNPDRPTYFFIITTARLLFNNGDETPMFSLQVSSSQLPSFSSSTSMLINIQQGGYPCSRRIRVIREHLVITTHNALPSLVTTRFCPVPSSVYQHEPNARASYKGIISTASLTRFKHLCTTVTFMGKRNNRSEL